MPNLKVTLPAEGTVQEEALVRDGKYFRKLKELCGHIEDGSDTIVSFHQDDATRDWALQVGQKCSVYGPSLESVIDMAIKDQQS